MCVYLSRVSPLPETNPTMLANGLQPCQSNGGVLQSASFPSPDGGFLVWTSPMALRSLPNVFYTCGKTCGKSRIIDSWKSVERREERDRIGETRKSRAASAG